MPTTGIHGVIDGGSRFIVSMNAVDNKLSDTVAAFFIKRVAELGVPHKVRADKGTENVFVRDFVWLLREAGYKCRYIEGPSVHNQRIERWWGDLCPYIVPIATALNNLTKEGVLDVEIPLHREALHSFLLPFVNRVLTKVLGAWHHHRVSSPGMKCTPAHKCEYQARVPHAYDRLQLTMSIIPPNALPPSLPHFYPPFHSQRRSREPAPPRPLPGACSRDGLLPHCAVPRLRRVARGCGCICRRASTWRRLHAQRGAARG